MYECNYCTRSFRTRQSCDQHMNDTNHWSFECDTCTREFGSRHAKEQHMTAVGHWVSEYRTSWATTSIQPLRISTNIVGQNNEDRAVRVVAKISGMNKLSSHQHILTSCIA